MLEQVTRELNIEALPTDIPDAIVRGRLGAGDRRDHAPLRGQRAEGVDVPRRPRGDVIATVIVPTEVEEPEIEEETELVGEDGEPHERATSPPRARRGRGGAEGEATPAEEAEDS